MQGMLAYMHLSEKSVCHLYRVENDIISAMVPDILALRASPRVPDILIHKSYLCIWSIIKNIGPEKQPFLQQQSYFSFPKWYT
jgi:hypothetical protein